MSSLPSSNGARARPAQAGLARYRLDIALRVLAATGGAYALAAASAYCMALLLPVSRIDAVLASTMLAFLIFAVAAMWSFRCASLVRLWVGLLAATAIMWALARFLI